MVTECECDTIGCGLYCNLYTVGFISNNDQDSGFCKTGISKYDFSLQLEYNKYNDNIESQHLLCSN